HFALFGKSGLAYSPLYPIVLSPIYALTSSMHTAYEWAKVENALLISLSVFPVYAIARFVLPRGRSVGVAALSLIAPLMLYSGVALVAGRTRTAMNGGNLPLAGRYANVGTAHASAWRVVALFFQHLAELDFAVGVIPFAAALLAGYALARFGFPRNGLVFASVAVASTLWLLLEVALDAAAFDATSPRQQARSAFNALPRLHERYLI